MKQVSAVRATKPDKRNDLDGTTLEVLSAQPGHLVRRCQQLVLALWMEETAEFDITPVQYAALAAIAAQPGVDATRLSDMISFDRSTLGDVLERIEGRGWVKRRAVPTDRRKKTLWLTDEGKDMFRRVTPRMFRAQERFLKPLSSTDSALFIRLASRLVGLHTGQDPST